MFIKFTHLVISSLILSLINSYTLSQQTCQQSFNQQSPINIQSLNSIFMEEKYFRLLTNTYNIPKETKWYSFTKEKSIGIQSEKSNLGSIVLIKDWAMQGFILDKILFRIDSEHMIDNQKFDVEMQLIHTWDASYYSPGRRINLGINYFVISIFYKITNDDDDSATKLFDFMNLSNFTSFSDTTMKKEIKLNHIVQNQPAYLYEGTLTYPDCQKALWYINTQYHKIKRTDFENLEKALKQYILTTGGSVNNRDVNAGNYEVLRNFQDLEVFTPKVTRMTYAGAEALSKNIILMLIILAALFI